jgi:hypothetical protein
MGTLVHACERGEWSFQDLCAIFHYILNSQILMEEAGKILAGIKDPRTPMHTPKLVFRTPENEEGVNKFLYDVLQLYLHNPLFKKGTDQWFFAETFLASVMKDMRELIKELTVDHVAIKAIFACVDKYRAHYGFTREVFLRWCDEVKADFDCKNLPAIAGVSDKDAVQKLTVIGDQLLTMQHDHRKSNERLQLELQSVTSALRSLEAKIDQLLRQQGIAGSVLSPGEHTVVHGSPNAGHTSRHKRPAQSQAPASNAIVPISPPTPPEAASTAPVASNVPPAAKRVRPMSSKVYTTLVGVSVKDLFIDKIEHGPNLTANIPGANTKKNSRANLHIANCMKAMNKFMDGEQMALVEAGSMCPSDAGYTDWIVRRNNAADRLVVAVMEGLLRCEQEQNIITSYEKKKAAKKEAQSASNPTANTNQKHRKVAALNITQLKQPFVTAVANRFMALKF